MHIKWPKRVALDPTCFRNWSQVNSYLGPFAASSAFGISDNQRVISQVIIHGNVYSWITHTNFLTLYTTIKAFQYFLILLYKINDPENSRFRYFIVVGYPQCILATIVFCWVQVLGTIMLFLFNCIVKMSVCAIWQFMYFDAVCFICIIEQMIKIWKQNLFKLN